MNLVIRTLWTWSLGPCERIREDEFSSNWPSNDRVETPRFLGVLNEDPKSFKKTWAVAPSELDHFRKLEKLIWPCAGQLALHPLPIGLHVILHSGATQSLYDRAENRISCSLSLCFLPFIRWRLVCRKNNGDASKSSKSSELSNMYWAARNKTSNLTEFRIGWCWNLAIMFVCLHSLPIFIQHALVLIPELTSSVDKKTQVFLVPIFIVWTRTLAFTLSREVISRTVHNRVNMASIVWTYNVYVFSFLLLLIFTDNQRWLWKVSVDFWIWWKQYKVRK